jgi:hypothetical protein
VRFETQTCEGGNQVDLERLSFKGALDMLNHFADAVHSAHGKPRRSEPKVQKRHPKAYPFLAKPVAKCVLLPTILSESNPYLSAIRLQKPSTPSSDGKKALPLLRGYARFSQKDLKALIWSR